jgi:hypothetical protein
MDAEKAPFQRPYFLLVFRPQDSDLFGCPAHLTVKLYSQNGAGCFLKGVAFFALQAFFIKIYPKMAQKECLHCNKFPVYFPVPSSLFILQPLGLGYFYTQSHQNRDVTDQTLLNYIKEKAI